MTECNINNTIYNHNKTNNSFGSVPLRSKVLQDIVPIVPLTENNESFLINNKNSNHLNTKEASTYNNTSKYGNLSAKNIMIRRKLMEKKRFDSADYSMDKAMDTNINHLNNSIYNNIDSTKRNEINIKNKSSNNINNNNTTTMLNHTPITSNPIKINKTNELSIDSNLIHKDILLSNKYNCLSPAQIGIQIFREAMEMNHLNTNDLSTNNNSSTLTDTPKNNNNNNSKNNSNNTRNNNNNNNNNKTNTTKQNSSKYGLLSAKNIMIQKKLREKKKFDSADHQLNKYASNDYKKYGISSYAHDLAATHITHPTNI